MSTKGIADVVFVIDASGSMKPCIEAVKANIGSFVASLNGPNSAGFDLRLEFIALKVDPTNSIFVIESSRSDSVREDLYGDDGQGVAGRARLWSNPDEFRKGLERIEVGADEDSLIAIDFALDLPWRKAAGCHRIVVLLTDEPAETGYKPKERASAAPQLVQKINDLRVKLFIVAPYSPVFAELQAADGADYIEIQDADIGKGLATTDFRKIFGAIAKSISVASLQSSAKSVKRGLFGQAQWGYGSGFDLNSAG